jgi:hypothetical protein
MHSSSEKIGRIQIMYLEHQTLICRWSKIRGQLLHYCRYLMTNKIRRKRRMKGYLCHHIDILPGGKCPRRGTVVIVVSSDAADDDIDDDFY